MTGPHQALRWLFRGWFLGVLLPLNAFAGVSPEQQRELTEAHNRWRADAGVDALAWAADLADVAQGWADRLSTHGGCRMSHSRNPALGENLFWASALRWSDGRREPQSIGASQVVDAWGAEKGNYNPDRNRCRFGRRCGHYTQLVWKASTEVGCGMARCPDQSQVWVCNYRPAGNRRGARPY